MPPRRCSPRHATEGFTLVELIVAITLIGVIAVAAMPLLQLPLKAYLDGTRRGDLGGELDVVAAKLRDDLAQALPGSVRVDATGLRLEYLRVRAVGRYRSGAAAAAVCTGGAANDVLQFGVADNRFATLGSMSGLVPGSDYVVLNPMAVPGDVYSGGAAANGRKSRLLASTAGAGAAACLQVTSTTFTNPPPASKLFYVVAEPVSYVCNPAAGTLVRYWGYAIAATQPAAFAGGVPSAPLSSRVNNCRFTRTHTGTPVSGQMVSVWLRVAAAVAGSNADEGTEALLQFSVREVR